MWILLGIIALMPFEKNPHLYLSASFLGIVPDFTLIKLLGLIGVGWSAVELSGGRTRLGLFESKQARAFFLYLGAVIFAGIGSGAGLTPATRLLSILFFLPLALMAVRTEERARLALKAPALVMILVFPYAYRQMVRFGGRLGVGLNEANYVALALVLVLPLAFVFARQETIGWKRLFWVGGVGILLLEIVLTGSRGGFLGLLVVLALIAVRLSKRWILAGCGIACLVLVLLAFPTTLSSRLRASGVDSKAQDWGTQASTEERLQILQAGLRMVQANPLTGVGLGSFKPSSVLYGAHAAKIAHNTYLELAAEQGLPVLAAFLWLTWVTLASLRRSKRLAESAARRDLAEIATALRTGLAGYLVSATFLSAQFEKFFWLVVFLSICLERVAARLPDEEMRRAAVRPRPGRVWTATMTRRPVNG